MQKVPDNANCMKICGWYLQVQCASFGLFRPKNTVKQAVFGCLTLKNPQFHMAPEGTTYMKILVKSENEGATEELQVQMQLCKRNSDRSASCTRNHAQC